MRSSTSNFERTVPVLPWRQLGLVVALLTLTATAAWELCCRSWGYAPTLNDTPDLWAQQRGAVQPDSLVIIGDSRPVFDLDLDELEKGLGQRPLQLALPGSSAFPILADLAADESFHGTVICSLVPILFLAPGGPLMETSERALTRYRKQTLAQRAGHHLGMLLEERLAFLRREDLTLEGFLRQLPIPSRPGTGGPALPPYFQTVDAERRMRMTDACAQPGPLQTRIKQGWIPLFTPPPPPSYVPEAAFVAGMEQAIEARFRDTAGSVQKLRARGGKIVFVRFPVSGELKSLEDQLTPRSGPWTRILNETGAPGIYFEDHPELSSFECPESSHLSAPDSVEFTKRLVPLLREATRSPGTTAQPTQSARL